jgi:glucose/arabinose dehydrogenase
MMKKLLLPILPVILAATLNAQVSVQLVPVATGLSDVVGLAHANDERLFCVLRPGTIRIIQNEAVVATPFLSITSLVQSSGTEQGLLGLAFDPAYSENGYFYVHYTATGNVSTIARYQVSESDPNVADPASAQVIYTYQQPQGNHNGGDVQFGPDGYLYFSLGEGGGGGDSQNNAQNLNNPLGAILRINVHPEEGVYSIPESNPFATAGGGVRPEIWAYGLRNPWRMGFDALTGDFWTGDVGQNAWEEIDFWPAGEEFNSGPNFGWRCYEGLVPFSPGGCGAAEEYVFPVAVHPNGPWLSIIGGRVYRGTQFPSLYGRYIYTDYSVGQIWSLLPDGEGGWENEMILASQGAGIVVISENHELELFLGNRNNGTVYKLVDPTVEVREERQPMLNIYPVPAREQLIVEGELQGVREMMLFDAAGRQVAARSIATDVVRATLQVEHLNAGAYVLVLNDASGRQVARRLVSVMK